MSTGYRTLALAGRPRVIAALVARIWMVVAVLLVVPVLVSALLGDVRLALVVAAVAVAMALTGWLLAGTPHEDDIQANEAMAVTALVFISVPLWCTPLFASIGIPPGHALFESVAAVTTAGLTVLPSLADLSPAFLFTRAWMQWFGGLGFVVLAVALVSGPGVAARRIAMEFDRDPGFARGTRTRARQVLLVYGSLTVAGFTALWLVSGDPFLSLVHALAATATGGYSTFDQGPAGFGAVGPQVVILVLCVLGALSFDLHGRMHRSQWRAFLYDPGLHALLAAIVLVAVLVAMMEGASDLREGWGALRLAVMAQTTAGFTTDPLSSLTPASQALLALSMLVGGDIGSTAGGVKLLRVLIVLQLVRLLLERAALPRHAVVAARVDGRRVGESEIVAILAFLALLCAVILGSWLVFVASGQPPFAAFIEVVAAVSTGGLSAGLIGPELPGHLKAVLAFDMLAGRLEVVALVVLLRPGTWFGRRRKAR